MSDLLGKNDGYSLVWKFSGLNRPLHDSNSPMKVLTLTINGHKKWLNVKITGLVSGMFSEFFFGNIFLKTIKASKTKKLINK